MNLTRLIALAAVVAAALAIQTPAAHALTPNEKFASRLHADFLNRPIDGDELAAAETRLTAGTLTRAQYVREVLGGEEFDSQWAVNIYRGYLGRNPSETEFNQAVALSSQSYNVLSEIVVIQTNEYYVTAGGTNTAYVQSLYLDLLFRTADPSGLNHWVGKLNNGTVNRGQVAANLIRGSEGARKRVGGAGVGVACAATDVDQGNAMQAGSFCLVLDRTVDPSGLTHWSASMQGSGELPTLWESLASSSEYYNLSQI